MYYFQHINPFIKYKHILRMMLGCRVISGHLILTSIQDICKPHKKGIINFCFIVRLMKSYGCNGHTGPFLGGKKIEQEGNNRRNK